MPNTTTAAPLKGVLLISGAALVLASMDTATKFLVGRHDIVLILGVRFLVHALLILAVYVPKKGLLALRSRRTGLVTVRGFCLMGAAGFMALSLQRMPVAESTAIFFLTPVVIALAAAPILGERTSRSGWVAAGTGFLGVLLISAPGSDLDLVGVLFGLAAVVCNTGYQLLSRELAKTETTVALMLYASLVGLLAFAPMSLFTLGTATWSPWDIVLMVWLGIASGLGHFLLTAAFRLAPASTLAPISYSQLMWATVLGLIAFSSVPSAQAVVGMCLIAAAGMIIIIDARLRSNQ